MITFVTTVPSSLQQERLRIAAALSLLWSAMLAAIDSIQLAQIWQLPHHPSMRHLIWPEFGGLTALFLGAGAFVGVRQIDHVLQQRHRPIGTRHGTWITAILVTAALAMLYALMFQHLSGVISASHLALVVTMVAATGFGMAWLTRPLGAEPQVIPILSG